MAHLPLYQFLLVCSLGSTRGYCSQRREWMHDIGRRRMVSDVEITEEDRQWIENREEGTKH